MHPMVTKEHSTDLRKKHSPEVKEILPTISVKRFIEPDKTSSKDLLKRGLSKIPERELKQKTPKKAEEIHPTVPLQDRTKLKKQIFKSPKETHSTPSVDYSIKPRKKLSEKLKELIPSFFSKYSIQQKEKVPKEIHTVLPPVRSREYKEKVIESSKEVLSKLPSEYLVDSRKKILTTAKEIQPIFVPKHSIKQKEKVKEANIIVSSVPPKDFKEKVIEVPKEVQSTFPLKHLVESRKKISKHDKLTETTELLEFPLDLKTKKKKETRSTVPLEDSLKFEKDSREIRPAVSLEPFDEPKKTTKPRHATVVKERFLKGPKRVEPIMVPQGTIKVKMKTSKEIEETHVATPLENLHENVIMPPTDIQPAISFEHSIEPTKKVSRDSEDIKTTITSKYKLEELIPKELNQTEPIISKEYPAKYKKCIAKFPKEILPNESSESLKDLKRIEPTMDLEYSLELKKEVPKDVKEMIITVPLQDSTDLRLNIPKDSTEIPSQISSEHFMKSAEKIYSKCVKTNDVAEYSTEPKKNVLKYLKEKYINVPFAISNERISKVSKIIEPTMISRNSKYSMRPQMKFSREQRAMPSTVSSEQSKEIKDKKIKNSKIYSTVSSEHLRSKQKIPKAKKKKLISVQLKFNKKKPSKDKKETDIIIPLEQYKTPEKRKLKQKDSKVVNEIHLNEEHPKTLKEKISEASRKIPLTPSLETLLMSNTPILNMKEPIRILECSTKHDDKVLKGLKELQSFLPLEKLSETHAEEIPTPASSEHIKAKDKKILEVTKNTEKTGDTEYSTEIKIILKDTKEILPVASLDYHKPSKEKFFEECRKVPSAASSERYAEPEK
ncbi:hypothetical protein CDAR_481301 [Caerostris darwini]|uniref:Uncharacterized protein n=1 Tax=Caerostris darwini TaxID=1538125 RepID=A0AAV4NB41_9ARAC|nr:hypothetical protein CDAR_481301 [Caerostris darwini]